VTVVGDAFPKVFPPPFPPPADGLPDPSPVAVGADDAPLLLTSLQEERMDVRGGIPAEAHPHWPRHVEYTA
jgi:hypothetical protein